MNLNQANKKIALRRATEIMLKKVDRGLALQMELVVLLVLHDKFGFGAKRCLKAISEFEDMWDSINKNYLTLEDIAETVKNEIGLSIEDDTLLGTKE